MNKKIITLSLLALSCMTMVEAKKNPAAKRACPNDRINAPAPQPNPRADFVRALREVTNATEDDDDEMEEVSDMLEANDPADDEHPFVSVRFRHDNLQVTPVLYALYIQNTDLLETLMPYLTRQQVIESTTDFPPALEYLVELETDGNTDPEFIEEVRTILVRVAGEQVVEEDEDAEDDND